MDVRVVRSAGRVKTVSAKIVEGTLVVQAPAHISDEKLAPIIARLQLRIGKREIKRALGDDDLQARVWALNEQYFGGTLIWASISWVTNQEHRWGSCTPTTGAIRISHRLAEVPPFVLDYVIVHELAHLLEANHGPRFWALAERFPRSERARGYLMALAGEEREDDM